jgi:SAM-dependent methyltransferase
MNSMHEIELPKLSLDAIDIYHAKMSIASGIVRNLEFLSGTLLDVGCGRMPYKEILMSDKTRVSKYIGLDLETDQIYMSKPDLLWDGKNIPLQDCSVDCALATEVMEHCPNPQLFLSEVHRVLKSGGVFVFTVPFLWPLHDVPYDEYRYTPFSLDRHLKEAGFSGVKLESTGGWDASLAQMIGLWARRRFGDSRKHKIAKFLFSLIALPIIWTLLKNDVPKRGFLESSMFTGFSGIAIKK